MLHNMDLVPRRPKSLFILCLRRRLRCLQVHRILTPTMVLVKLFVELSSVWLSKSSSANLVHTRKNGCPEVRPWCEGWCRRQTNLYLPQVHHYAKLLRCYVKRWKSGEPNIWPPCCHPTWWNLLKSSLYLSSCFRLPSIHCFCELSCQFRTRILTDVGTVGKLHENFAVAFALFYSGQQGSNWTGTAFRFFF